MSASSGTGPGLRHTRQISTLYTAVSASALPAKNFSLLTLLKRFWPWQLQLILKMTAALLVSSREKRWPGSMLISGVWHLCDDGIMRPVIRAEVLASDGSWVKVPFLMDTG